MFGTAIASSYPLLPALNYIQLSSTKIKSTLIWACGLEESRLQRVGNGMAKAHLQGSEKN